MSCIFFIVNHCDLLEHIIIIIFHRTHNDYSIQRFYINLSIFLFEFTIVFQSFNS